MGRRWWFSIWHSKGWPVVAFVMAVATAGCGGARGSGSANGPNTPSQESIPDIVKFDGPSIISCSTSGEIKVVSFAYETKNAAAVKPEVDGVAPAGGAAYDPGSGTVNFDYVCPGPHTFKLSAVGENNRAAVDSITFDENNRAVSSTSSVDVEASPG